VIFLKKENIKKIITTILLIASFTINASEIKSYGHYQKMIHKADTTGVVDLKSTINGKNNYAVGAIAGGIGEITIIDNKVYLDYGKDGLGKSLNTIPKNTQAVLLATTKVKKWQDTKIINDLTKKELFAEILKQAKIQGFSEKTPFPFLLKGQFESLKIHAIASQNPKFGGHGSKQKLFHMAKDELIDEVATIVGFYSAGSQGVYTHPGESWHMHAVIENISGHIDGLQTGENVILKLPADKHTKNTAIHKDKNCTPPKHAIDSGHEKAWKKHNGC
jgi:hypothetical protein